MFGSAMLLPRPAALSAGGIFRPRAREDQIVKEANKPQLVTMASTDAAKGIKNNKGVVILDQTGPTSPSSGPGWQPGRYRFGQTLVPDKHGKDVDNSNANRWSLTRVHHRHDLAGVGEYKKGDKVNTMISGSATGIGLVYKKPAGEPAVPSVIFSAWKID